MAKSYATEAAQRIVDDAVQVLGGEGVLASHPVDRLYRAVRALRIYEGTTEIQRLVIAGAAAQAGGAVNAVSIGGGPAGLFFALLLKKADPRHEVTVYERNRARRHVRLRRGVLRRHRSRSSSRPTPRSRAAMAAPQPSLGRHRHPLPRPAADARPGTAFSGLSRRTLLSILLARCRALGVKLCLEREIQDPDEVRARRPRAGRGRRQFADARALSESLPPDRRAQPQQVRLARHARARSARSRSHSATTGTACGACTPTSTSRAPRRSSSRRARRPGSRPGSIAPPRRTPPRSARSCSPPNSRAIG